MLLLCSNILRAQDRTVTGTVWDEKNEPLPGVTIQVKGSTAVTSTDVNGKYSIKVTNLQNVVIGASFVGYNYMEKTLRVGEKNADFRMTPSSKGLDEVVVVGYGEQKKIHLTGSVATIDVKKVEDIPTTNLSAALVGQAPNVNVSGANLRPGTSATITVRNPVFFSKDGNTSPLYVIDDAFRTQQDFNLLDPSEVESISILKDAAAAIYGIQGANGVIVVRTKRGKAGAAKVSYSGSYGVTDATMLPKMMNSLQLATYLNDAAQAKYNYTITPSGYQNGDVTKPITSFYTPDELDYFANHSTNWLQQAFKPATLWRNTVNVSGGTDKVTYFAGFNYVNQTSNFKGVNTDKYGFRASVDAKVATGLKVSLSVSDDISESKSFWYKAGGESPDNDVLSLVSVAPWQQYYINGLPVLTSGTSANKQNTNFFMVQNSDNYTASNNYIMNALAKVTYDVPFIKGLQLAGTYNRNINNFFGKQYGTILTEYQFAGTGTFNHIPGGAILKPINISNGDRVRLNPTYSTNDQLDWILNYDKNFGKHHITFLALYEQQENYTEGVAAEADGVIIGGKDNQNFTTGVQSSNQQSQISEYGRAAYATRLDYSFANKYLLEAGFRADANTNFPPGHQWGYFPYGSLGWVASEEPWFKEKFGFFNLFKVRASIGLLGNDSTKPWQYQANYSFGTGKAAVIGTNGTSTNNDRGLAVYPNNAIANPYLTWDHNTKTNYGLDMQFLNNRLSVSADYYWEHRYDMLTTRSSSVPATIGATVPTENYSSVNTFGYELSVTWRDHIGKDFSYNFSPFLSWYDDKYLRYDLPAGNVGTYLDLTGKSDDQGILGYKYAGFFRTQPQLDQFMAAHPGYTIFGNTPQLGMIYYQDVRGPKDASGHYTAPDGKITQDDMTYIGGKANNHYGLGLNWGTSYKGLSLSVTMGMSFGGQGVVESQAYSLGNSSNNRPAFWADHWTPTNVNAKYPNPYYDFDYAVPSDFWFRNSLSFRVTNFNLSYTLPSRFSTKLGVSSVRVYVVGTNPLNFYNGFGYRDNAVGNILTYPNLKTYSFGLNVGF